jgi:hypothetical protein
MSCSRALTVFQHLGPILLAANTRWGSERVIMQHTLSRTTEASEDLDVKPVAEIEGVIRDLVRRDVSPANAKDAPDTAANVSLIVERATSLSELQTVIEELEQLYEFMHSEGARLEREISEYAQLSKSTKTSTRLIADNLLHRQKSSASKA